MNVDYYRAASAPKTLWKIPEAGHVGGFQARPQEYEQRVIGFFDRARSELRDTRASATWAMVYAASGLPPD